MSTFNLNAEYAYIDPDPNTKKSTIFLTAERVLHTLMILKVPKKLFLLVYHILRGKTLSPPDSLAL
jgi:hypothetical protein